MTLLNLALKNVMSNFRHYLLYFVSTITSIVIYFIFVTLKYAPATVLKTVNNDKVASAVASVSVVILVFVAVFIWLSNAYFVRSRKKEIGIYTFSGMKQKHVALMLFVENLMVGFFSIVVGVLVGLLLSRLATMLLAKMMGLETHIQFYFSLRGTVETVIAFSIIFLVTSVSSALMVYRFKVIDLINAHRSEEKEPRHSTAVAILGMVLMLSGYALSQCVMLFSSYILWVMLGTLALTITGTYLFFKSSTVLLLKHLKRQPAHIFKGTNILTTNHLIFRIQNNAKAMATIAVLSASTISAMGAALTFSEEIGNIYTHMTPYTIQMMADQKNAQVGHDFLNKELPKLGVKVAYDVTTDMLVYDGRFTPVRMDRGKTYDPFEFGILSQSQLRSLAVTTGKIRQLQHIDFNADEALFIEAVYNTAYFEKDEIKKSVTLKNGPVLTIKAHEDAVLIPHTVFKHYLIVKDEVYQALKQQAKSVEVLRFIDTSEPLKSDQLAKVYNRLPEKQKSQFQMLTFGELHGMVAMDKGVNLFLTIFVCLIFVMASGSVIYFKQLTDAVHEVRKYETLFKLGIHPEEIKSAISKQLRFMFGAPYLVAMVHSAFALMALSRMVGSNLTMIGIVASASYLFLYGIFYLFTRHSYYRIIEPKGL